jgi:hypothetical protein
MKGAGSEGLTASVEIHGAVWHFLLRKGERSMSNVTRNHKDNVFCLLYRDKKNLLSLYNAINGTSYQREEDLEVVTLEEAICLKIRNDAAFVIDSRLNLYEQQSSVNRNMPLRDLYYVTEELKKIAPPGRLHQKTRVEIPVPRFVVFYNGTEKQPERMIYKLSDSFCRVETDPELELKVTVININPGCNRELLEKCESLRGYMVFVEKVRAGRTANLGLEEAVRQAVEGCISQGILAEFFREHKEEVVEMGIYEFDQELHDRVLLEDGEAIGIKKGIEMGIHIYKEILEGNTDTKRIAEAIGCSMEEVERARKQCNI